VSFLEKVFPVLGRQEGGISNGEQIGAQVRRRLVSGAGHVGDGEGRVGGTGLARLL
jgi:hypothetical protein